MQTEKRTITNDPEFPTRSTVTSEETATVDGMTGKRYIIAQSTGDGTNSGYGMETILQYDANTIIDISGIHGNGSNSNQLAADMLTIHNSVNVTQ